MHIIDPDSHFESTIDPDGKPVELGGTDSQGYFVGYIDENGHPWESRHERDVATGSGRCLDAFHDYNRHGGVLGNPPDFIAIIRAHDVLPQHEDDAYRDFVETIRLIRASQKHTRGPNRYSMN